MNGKKLICDLHLWFMITWLQETCVKDRELGLWHTIKYQSGFSFFMCDHILSKVFIFSQTSMQEGSRGFMNTSYVTANANWICAQIIDCFLLVNAYKGFSC
jgi:hypothetical protein